MNADWETARIKVVGAGNCGGGAVRKMFASGLRGVQLICVDTDQKDLAATDAHKQILLEKPLIDGRNGALRLPAATRTGIYDALDGADMVFVLAGMGGGTGVRVAPEIARMAKGAGNFTVGAVTMPLAFEGSAKAQAANEALKKLKLHVDSLIVIPNDWSAAFASPYATFEERLRHNNSLLFHAVKAISEPILTDGLINIDIADLRQMMTNSGFALMGTGIASGENRARKAARLALAQLAFPDRTLKSVEAALYHITAPTYIASEEMEEIGAIIAEAMPQNARILFSLACNENNDDEIFVNLTAVGFEGEYDLWKRSAPARRRKRITRPPAMKRPVERVL